MRPDIIGVWRYVEVADQNPRDPVMGQSTELLPKAIDKIEFVSEFRVEARIRFVTPCGQIDIVQFHICDTHTVDPRVPLPAKVGSGYFLYRETRRDGNTMMSARLAINTQVGQPYLSEDFFRKLGGLTFNFL